MVRPVKDGLRAYYSNTNQAWGYLDAAGNFVLSDTRVYVIAGDDKFIKHYIEGEPIVIARDAADNADLTQEYTVIRREGIAVAVSATMGVYDFT